MVCGSLAQLASEAAGAGGWSFAQIAQRLSPAVSKFQASGAASWRVAACLRNWASGGAGACVFCSLPVITLPSFPPVATGGCR